MATQVVDEQGLEQSTCCKCSLCVGDARYAGVCTCYIGVYVSVCVCLCCFYVSQLVPVKPKGISLAEAAHCIT